ncbi:3-ketoacyl-ACP reductase [Rhizobium leguminosarum]|uniref:3-ketoacyl-ACP reductase n=1 Tax=Rhizobium leguminosarum TaxID=384 RepID=UPI00143F202D|nr:3-ketoacyl-ACP reductase [Rhizobium leguminosarum]NKL23369.1 3-ketoacyl-ACP reductase [Rhizobium leguminosarum bv. viciae]
MTRGETKRALVTGAGRGIGRAIALDLAKSGFDVVINDMVGSADLEETGRLVRKAGRSAHLVTADISDLDDHARVVSEAWDAFGGIECLVNNAGVSVAQRGDMLKTTPESFDRLMNINLRGPFFLTQAVATRMCEVPGEAFRCIITISSSNSEFTSTDRAEYCISKTGLSMMSSLYALRLAGEGINSYEVRPGVIRTNMTAVAREKYDRSFAEGFAPISRWGEPEDVGRVVASLASGAFSYSTGEVYRVDGGLAVRKL